MNYILFELDEGVTLDPSPYYWVKETPNVHKIRYSWPEEERDFSYGIGAYGYGFYGSSGTTTLEPSPRSRIVKVGSLLVDATVYASVGSITACNSTDESFYFDIPSQNLYINFTDDTNPWDYVDISLGVSKGYSNVQLVNENIEYEARIKSIPSSTISRDSLYHGLVSFASGSVTLDNMDHHFDTFDQEDIFGKICRIRYSTDNVTYTTLYSGKLDDYVISGDTIRINLKDARKSLESTIELETFNKTDYPDIDDNLVGTVIPVGWGIVKDSMAYSLDETAVSSFDFKFCYHAVQSIEKVRVDGVEVTPTATDLVNGEFTLSSSDYEAGQEVTIDYTGKNITNPLDIITDILTTYTTAEYNSTFFNITPWEAVRDAQTVELGLGLIETENIVDIIGRIALSIFGSFITDGDGRYNFKIVDNTKASVLTLYGWDYLEAPTLEYLSDEYLSSANICYLKGLVNEECPIYTNKTKETELFIKYDYKTATDFQTLLTTASDAEDYSDIVVDNFGGIFPTFTIKTKLQTLDIELEDLVDAQMYIKDNRFYYVRLEILSKTVDYINAEITIKGRFVLYLDELGNVTDLPYGSAMIRRLTPPVVSDEFPSDVIIEYDPNYGYVIQYDNIPDYIIEYQD